MAVLFKTAALRNGTRESTILAAVKCTGRVGYGGGRIADSGACWSQSRTAPKSSLSPCKSTDKMSNNCEDQISRSRRKQNNQPIQRGVSDLLCRGWCSGGGNIVILRRYRAKTWLIVASDSIGEGIRSYADRLSAIRDYRRREQRLRRPSRTCPSVY